MNNGMTPEEALIELSFHSGRNPDIDDPRWQSYFLGSLRPFQTMAQVESNYHHVIDCMRLLPIELFEGQAIPKELSSDIAGISCLGRAWAVYEGGMLRENKLISSADSERISEWLHIIDYAWMMLLETQDHDLAFESYSTERFFNSGKS